MIPKIKVGPSLKKRTIPTYRKELTYGFVMSTFTGLVNAILPIVVQKVNEAREKKRNRECEGRKE